MSKKPGYDRYDTEFAFYLVSVGSDGSVHTGVRLIKSILPNYTFDDFPGKSAFQSYRMEKVFELSCVSKDPECAPANSLLILIAGLIELGLNKHIPFYVSTTNKLVETLVNKLTWRTQPISPSVVLDKQTFTVLQYPVNQKTYENFWVHHQLGGPYLSEAEIKKVKR